MMIIRLIVIPRHSYYTFTAVVPPHAAPNNKEHDDDELHGPPPPSANKKTTSSEKIKRDFLRMFCDQSLLFIDPHSSCCVMLVVLGDTSSCLFLCY